MKTKKHAIYLGTALIGLAAMHAFGAKPAWADRIGNGGVGVVCRDSQGKVLNVQLLDIFEGENLGENPLTYPTGDLDVDARIQLVKLRMASNPRFLRAFQTKLARVKEKILILRKEELGLTPTNDAFPALYKKDCAFEQVANAMPDGWIRVDRELWPHLDPLNLAALYVHETVYAVAGGANSTRSRRLTMHVLASNGDDNKIRVLMKQLSKRLSAPPSTPPPAPPKSWPQTLTSGIYESDGGVRLCSIRIEHLGENGLLGTYYGGCAFSGFSATLEFRPGEKTSYESTSACHMLLNKITIVNATTFISAREYYGCGPEERLKVYRLLN